MPLTFTLISNVHWEEDMVVRESAKTEGVAEARNEGRPWRSAFSRLEWEVLRLK